VAPPVALGALVLAALLGALSYLSTTPRTGPTVEVAQVVHGLSGHIPAAAHARAPVAPVVQDAQALPGAGSVSTRGGRGEPVAERGGTDGQVGRARPASRLQPGRDDRRQDRQDALHALCAGSPPGPATSPLPASEPPACSSRHAAARLRRSRDAALHRMPRGPPPPSGSIRRR
jgi:hypothetical protein